MDHQRDMTFHHVGRHVLTMKSDEDHPRLLTEPETAIRQTMGNDEFHRITGVFLLRLLTNWHAGPHQEVYKTYLAITGLEM
jgi:hypothetical protein